MTTDGHRAAHVNQYVCGNNSRHVSAAPSVVARIYLLMRLYTLVSTAPRTLQVPSHFSGWLVYIVLFYKKLSYCRDSVRRPVLRCLRLFKVIDVGVNRKLVCDFLQC